MHLRRKDLLELKLSRSLEDMQRLVDELCEADEVVIEDEPAEDEELEEPVGE